MSAHTVDIYGEAEYGLRAVVRCHAEPGAPCRLYCPEGCENWSVGLHEHELKDYGECVMVEWLDNEGHTDAYGGLDNVPLSSGTPVHLWFDDGVYWEPVTNDHDDL